MTTQSAPVFAKGRDLEATAAVLRRWLAPRLGCHADDLAIGDLTYPSGAGLSNETILFEARLRGGDAVHELVLRTAPAPDYQLFLDPDFGLQVELLRTLERLGAVPVPQVLWYEEDPSVLGRPFFIMRRLHGRVPVTMPVYNAAGWLHDATPAQRRTAWESAMRQLAAIHTVPTDEVRMVDMAGRGTTGPEQQLSYWTDYAAWVFGEEVPDAFLALFEWLRANAPSGEPAGLSWGDARIGNMMFGDDFEVVAVLDWEQATLSGPMNDLGWWLYFDHMHSVESGLARLDGLGSRQETVDLWQELTGQRVADLTWWEAFSGLKTGLFAVRTAGVLTRMGVEIPNSQPTHFLRPAHRLAGLAEPA